jgi:putative ABC transport system permease protein
MEGGMIAGAGIAAGLGLAWGLLRVLILVMPPDQLPDRFLRFDGSVLAFTIAVGAAAGLLLGILPAWQVTKLGGSRSAAPRQRMRSALVVAEVALALVLLVGAGLFLRSLRNLQLVNPGFDTHGLMTAELQFPPGDGTPERHAQFFRAVADRLKATPGITDAAISSAIPFLSTDTRYGFAIPGRDLSGDPFFEDGQIAGMARRITRDYFSTLGVRITSGRGFTDSDVKGSEPVLIADEALAARYFPRQDAVGQHLHLGRKPHRIIGVAASIRQMQPGTATERPLFYLPMYADPVGYGGFLVRGTGNLAQTLREAVQSVNPSLALFNAQPLEERVHALLWPRQVVAWVLTFFAGSALFLAALGLYGVISYSVSQRVQEIGVRMALGARASQVVRLVLGQGLRLALLGSALGLIGAIAVSRALARQLFQVGVLDPVAFGGMALLLIAVASAASWLPARRAASVDPLIALRRE